MKILIKKSLAVVALSLAALVDNGTYFTDTVNQLDFLKLSATTSQLGHSYQSVVIQDQFGYLAQGWQIMDQSAVAALSSSERE